METPFKNELILPENISPYESLPLVSPDPKYWHVIRINLLICGLILIVAIAMMSYYSPLETYQKIGIGSLALITYGLTWWLYKISFSRRGYALRQKDIVYKSGLLIERTSVIPINRIQHIGLEEGLFLRMYDLANLVIYTAAIHGSPLTIKGLPKELAFQIKTALLDQSPSSETL